MFRFRSKEKKELEGIIEEMKINLANNYKSTAHAARERLGRRVEELNAAGKLKEEDYRHYREIFDRYTEMLKDYHH